MSTNQLPPDEDNRFPRLPEFHSFASIEWQLFVTLTFKHKWPGLKIGKDMLHAWIRHVAKAQGARFERVLFLSRLENGSSGDHWHLHVLVGGLGFVNPGLYRAAETLWEKRGGGDSQVSIFDRSRDGVGYVLAQPADYIRSRRISDDALFIPTPSESVLALARKRNR